MSGNVSTASRVSAAGFTTIPLNHDPLRGACGLSWFERKPRSLSQQEREALDSAVQSGQIPCSEYFDWKKNVR